MEQVPLLDGGQGVVVEADGVHGLLQPVAPDGELQEGRQRDLQDLCHGYDGGHARLPNAVEVPRDGGLGGAHLLGEPTLAHAPLPHGVLDSVYGKSVHGFLGAVPSVQAGEGRPPPCLWIGPQAAYAAWNCPVE